MLLPAGACPVSTMNPNLDWSDDDYIYSSDVPARLPTEAEHAAWLAEQEARIARAALNRKPFIKHVNLPESGDWVDDPFADIKFPFGAFLEPAGYATIQAMRKPNTRSYRRHMPRTTALARTIYDALPEVDVWGRQRPKHEAAWETITAGPHMLEVGQDVLWIGGTVVSALSPRQFRKSWKLPIAISGPGERVARIKYSRMWGKFVVEVG